MDQIIVIFQSLADKYPVVVGILSVMGFLRAIFKPLFAFVRSIAAATETKKDDEFLDKVESSKVYSTISFILDWFASIKLPQKQPAQIQLPENKQ